jgi:hypothetical protein
MGAAGIRDYLTHRDPSQFFLCPAWLNRTGRPAGLGTSPPTVAGEDFNLLFE